MIDLGPHSQFIWTVLLAALLFWPVRQLIWVLAIRRAQARNEGRMPDQGQMGFLRRKASLTAGLLCFLFAFFYVGTLFGG